MEQISKIWKQIADFFKHLFERLFNKKKTEPIEDDFDIPGYKPIAFEPIIRDEPSATIKMDAGEADSAAPEAVDSGETNSAPEPVAVPFSSNLFDPEPLAFDPEPEPLAFEPLAAPEPEPLAFEPEPAAPAPSVPYYEIDPRFDTLSALDPEPEPEPTADSTAGVPKSKRAGNLMQLKLKTQHIIIGAVALLVIIGVFAYLGANSKPVRPSQSIIVPTAVPIGYQTAAPTAAPTASTSGGPTIAPTAMPTTAATSGAPSGAPTVAPTAGPTPNIYYPGAKYVTKEIVSLAKTLLANGSTDTLFTTYQVGTVINVDNKVQYVFGPDEENFLQGIYKTAIINASSVVRAADFDNDGKDEIVTYKNSGKDESSVSISIMKQDQAGTYKFTEFPGNMGILEKLSTTAFVKVGEKIFFITENRDSTIDSVNGINIYAAVSGRVAERTQILKKADGKISIKTWTDTVNANFVHATKYAG